MSSKNEQSRVHWINWYSHSQTQTQYSHIFTIKRQNPLIWLDSSWRHSTFPFCLFVSLYQKHSFIHLDGINSEKNTPRILHVRLRQMQANVVVVVVADWTIPWRFPFCRSEHLMHEQKRSTKLRCLNFVVDLLVHLPYSSGLKNNIQLIIDKFLSTLYWSDE